MPNFFSNGFNGYDYCISDHLPVGIRLWTYTSDVNENVKQPSNLKQIVNIEGKRVEPSMNQLQFLIFEDGSVQKNIIIE